MAKLTKPARDRISTTKFAFPKQRKEPLENASHVRNAVARFNQGRALRKRNVVRRGNGYSLPQSDTEWNLKSPTSVNTPRCKPAMATIGGTCTSLSIQVRTYSQASNAMIRITATASRIRFGSSRFELASH